MDIEALRYVLTLAEELHFGRSARRHYIGEAQFGRRIRRLEAEIGVQIFARTSRRVALTAEGRDVVAQARSALLELDELRPVADASVGALRVGVLGFGVGDRWSRLRDLVRAAVPGVEFAHRSLTLADQYLALRRHKVDVGLVHYLGEVEGLELLPVMETPRIAIVPAESSFAQAERLSVGDVASRRWLRLEGSDDRFADWVGPPATTAAGPLMTALDTVATAVATTGMLSVHGAAAAQFYTHPDVRFVPLDGAAVITAVAIRKDDDRPVVEAFRVAARSVTQLPPTA